MGGIMRTSALLSLTYCDLFLFLFLHAGSTLTQPGRASFCSLCVSPVIGVICSRAEQSQNAEDPSPVQPPAPHSEP